MTRQTGVRKVENFSLVIKLVLEKSCGACVWCLSSGRRTLSDQKPEAEGAWIFLSHSHRDLAKVRQIRDELERKGHNPLIFFLKCLEDDGAELPDLLRREIGARNWFILCDSPNARSSKWVQEEIQMIKSLEGKVFEVVDLSKDLQTELHKLTDISKRATIFLSYTSSDAAIAQQVGAALTRVDFRVFQDIKVSTSADFQSAIKAAIDKSLANGFVLLLLSPNSLTSPFCKAETEYALRRAQASQRSNVVPVIVKDGSQFLAKLPLQLAAVQYFDLTPGDFEDKIARLIHILKTRQME